MLLLTIIVLCISLAGIVYPLFFQKNTDSHVLTTQETAAYVQAYYQQLHMLDQAKKQEIITDLQYQQRLLQLQRDLLKQSNQLTLHNKKPYILSSIALLSAFGVATFYYGVRYEAWHTEPTYSIARLDDARQNIQPYMKQWLAQIQAEGLRPSAPVDTLNPPFDLLTYYVESIQALQSQLSQEGLTDTAALRLLANLYMTIELPQMALAIYERLEQLTPHELDILLALGQLHMSLNQNQMTDIAERYFQASIQQAPEDDHARILYAVALFTAQRYQDSLEQWHYLQDKYVNDTEMGKLINLSIAKIEEQIADSQQAKQLHITLNFNHTEKLSQLPDQAVIYVIGKIDSNPQPYIVQRLKLSTFPVTVTLTDQNRLNPSGPKLHQIEHLQLSARISLTGDPIAQPEDVSTPTLTLSAEQFTQPIQLDFDPS